MPRVIPFDSDYIQKVLKRIKKKNDQVKQIVLGNYSSERYRDIVVFNSSNSDDFSTLGRLIGKNTHLTKLSVKEDNLIALDASNRDFYDGLTRNSSINDLFLSNRRLLGEVAEGILRVYKENNSLTRLVIVGANLRNGSGHSTLVTTLQRCTNLIQISLLSCNINDEILLPIVEAIRGRTSLEKLHLNNNRIRRAGSTALAALLEDTNCNVTHLHLNQNRIDNEGMTAIANSLANNTSLRTLDLHHNSISSKEPFCNVLCNTTSINSIHSSNHTLENLMLYLGNLSNREGPELLSLLKMNKTKNKRQVAIRKVLKYNPNMDMEPYFADWISDDEQTLKGLPYVLALFEKANKSYDGGPRKLSAIFQFTRAMPLSFAAAAPFDVESKKKRKRGYDYQGKGYKFDKELKFATDDLATAWEKIESS
jgi:hypothetical protein